MIGFILIVNPRFSMFRFEIVNYILDKNIRKTYNICAKNALGV